MFVPNCSLCLSTVSDNATRIIFLFLNLPLYEDFVFYLGMRIRSTTSKLQQGLHYNGHLPTPVVAFIFGGVIFFIYICNVDKF